MILGIMKAVPKVIFATDNLAVVPGFATLIPAVDGSLSFLKVTNALLPLKRMSYIYHLIRFEKNQAKIQALLDFGSKINAMTPAYAAKLGLKDQSTNVGAQKIENSTLKTLGKILANF